MVIVICDTSEALDTVAYNYQIKTRVEQGDTESLEEKFTFQEKYWICCL
jgi:hypothetical protein